MIFTQQTIKSTLTYKLFSSSLNECKKCIETVGAIGSNLMLVFKSIFTFNADFKQVLAQSARFGVDSLPITLSMVGVTGMIIALQVAGEMVKQGAGDYVGSLVTVIMVREIGVIMSGFAIISMIGSSMAAEIGTMKVTEQIDVMKVLKVNPIDYILAPRFIAGAFMMPIVVVLATLIGIVGGMIVSNITTGLSFLNYIESVWGGLAEKDIFVCLLKATVFGGIISLISTSIGYKTSGGAIDVGRSTTEAVVWCFVGIVIADYIISLIFFV